MNCIKLRLETLNNNIQKAAQKCGRGINDIEVVYVSKYAQIDDVIEAVKLGCYSIGENQFQELKRKYTYIEKILPQDQFKRISWHFIGHLQTNKIKGVLQYASMIQSIDSLRLAQAVNKQAGKINIARMRHNSI